MNLHCGGRGPLSHLTVIEMAGLGPGPFAGMVLADFGAKVIRVDRASSATAWGPKRTESPVSRGRHSIAVNLKDPGGIALVLELVAKADILIEGFRPGVMERLGLGPQICHDRNARLIYGRITGWGQHGPLSQAAGHDLNYISLSGALHAMGSKDRPPPPPLNLLGDYGGGAMLLLVGILAALAEAQRSGRGQVVDAAMSDGAALLMAAQYGLQASGSWHEERGSNFLDGSAHFYATYECADGRYISVAPLEPQFYKELLELCGVDDPHFDKQWEKSEWPALQQKFTELFRSRSRAQWCDLLEGADACFAPVLSMNEAPHHPHNVARGTFVEVEGLLQPAPAPRLDRTPGSVPPRAPQVGQHTADVLKELGRSESEIEALIRAGIVHSAPAAARHEEGGFR